jgi:hypothetical protein
MLACIAVHNAMLSCTFQTSAECSVHLQLAYTDVVLSAAAAAAAAAAAHLLQESLPHAHINWCQAVQDHQA